MCRSPDSGLIETIKLLDGAFFNLSFHNERLNRSRRDLWGCQDTLDLQSVLPAASDCGLYKCRVVYAETVVRVSVEPYRKRIIRSLRLVEDNEVVYAYKYENRDKLSALSAQRAGCDEIIIVKHKLVTDTSYTNLAFFTGQAWLTPATPLLKGTKRAQLLASGSLKEEEIRISDLKKFKKVALINAMLDLGECELAIEQIID
jgi:4-amino-4-deoxychorismate lyase